MYFVRSIGSFLTRLSLVLLLFCTIGYAAQQGQAKAGVPADTAERFDAFQKAVQQGINLKILGEATTNAKQSTLSQQEALGIMQKFSNRIMAIITPYTKEIMIPRSETDATLVPYRVIDLKKLEGLTPEQIKTSAEANKSNLKFDDDMDVIPFKYPELFKNYVGKIAAQFVMFDSEARAQLSPLLINWFNTVTKEISGLLGLIKDKEIFTLIGDGPLGLVDKVEKIRTKARQYENTAAPLLALWHILVQGILGENKYTMLFGELPNSEAIKTAYNNALKSLDIKKALEKFLKEKGPFIDKEHDNRLFTNDLALWTMVGILFTPDKFEKAFVEEPLKQEEEDRKQREAAWKKIEAELEPAKKAYEAAQEKFTKLMANNPDIMESDFSGVFRFGTLTPLDENAINKRIAERKTWLAKHPGAMPEDFDNSMRMYWILRGLNEEPHDSNEETVLPKFIQARKNWLQKYPDAVPEDFYGFHYWEESELQQYLAKRKSWLAQNLGKTRNDYLDFLRALEKAEPIQR